MKFYLIILKRKQKIQQIVDIQKYPRIKTKRKVFYPQISNNNSKVKGNKTNKKNKNIKLKFKLKRPSLR